MPRGGKRLGAGRKPLTRRERWLGGNASKVPLALVTSSPERVSAAAETMDGEVPEPPLVLTEDEAAYWRLWAPLARARGLLSEETKPGLVLLCQQARRAAEMWSDIASRGMVHEKVTMDGAGQEHHEFKAHPLLTHWRGLMHRIEQLQARYGIAADGKIAGEAAQIDEEREQLAQLLAVK